MKDYNMVNEVLKMAAANGYKCYMVNSNYYHYGFMITPNNNILYIQAGDFWGVDIALQYKPGPKTGTGCRCNEESLNKVTLKTLQQMEKEGLKFARRLKAVFYKNPAEWLENYWDRKNLIEVTND